VADPVTIVAGPVGAMLPDGTVTGSPEDLRRAATRERVARHRRRRKEARAAGLEVEELEQLEHGDPDQLARLEASVTEPPPAPVSDEDLTQAVARILLALWAAGIWSCRRRGEVLEPLEDLEAADGAVTLLPLARQYPAVVRCASWLAFPLWLLGVVRRKWHARATAATAATAATTGSAPPASPAPPAGNGVTRALGSSAGNAAAAAAAARARA
jgi:hypothetical protein